MNPAPLVTAYVPAYNHAEYVEHTLQSLAEQTYSRIEMIVINDGSTDDTGGVVARFRDLHKDRFERFEFIEQENQGVSATTNTALKLAQGEFIFHIASDDGLCEPRALEHLVDIMLADNSVGVACGDACFIDATGETTTIRHRGRDYESFIWLKSRHRFDIDKPGEFGSYRSLLAGNYIPVGLLIRMAAYDKIGRFRAGKYLEDYDLWLRIAKHYRISLYRGVLSEYRIHANNASGKLGEHIARETGELLLREKDYAIAEGHARQWSSGALLAGLRIIRHCPPGDWLMAARMLLLSIAARLR